jgi:ABC-type glycerol-3-phosphate transport system substrate-binding protein
MSKFQLIFITVFVICIIGGVAAFATYKSTSESNRLPLVTIWGSFPASVFNSYINKINQNISNPLNVSYVEISQQNFRQNLIESLANGQGPDAILIPQTDLYGYYDKIIPIPNEALSTANFKSSFVSQAELYLTPNGALAVPFVIDPLVMYWNRTMFTNAGIAKQPQYWEDFVDVNKKITSKDINSNIRKSAIALGEFANLNNAREILSALLLQAGNPITLFTENGLISTIGNGSYSGSDISAPALTFFTQFADPRNPQYSWNRSLPSSKSSFLSGTLATYFGFTSELLDIREKNPNLDFDVSRFPQAKNGSIRTTYGNMYGFSIIKSTANVGNTYTVIDILTNPSSMNILNEFVYLPSVRREVIASGSADPYMTMFLDSALISRGWVDSNSNRSNAIFKDMVESVTSGRADIYNALKQANDELDLSLKNR